MNSVISMNGREYVKQIFELKIEVEKYLKKGRKLLVAIMDSEESHDSPRIVCCVF